MNLSESFKPKPLQKQWVLALSVAVLSALPYLTGLHHPFVFDDHGVIAENGFLNQPTAWLHALSLRTMLDRRIVDSGRPTVIVSYLIDRLLWGLKPFGYHLTNVLLHASVVILIFAGAYRILRKMPEPDSGSAAFRAFAAALLFGLHPALAEAVQIPAFREDLLVTAGLIAFLMAATRHPLAALLLLIPTLAAKESGVIALPLLLWFWLCFHAYRPSPQRAILLAAGTAIACAAFVATWFFTQTFQALSNPHTPPPLPFPTNLWTLPWLWTQTLRYLIWPHPLRAEHLVDPVPSPTDPRCAFGFVLLLAVAVIALRTRHRQPFFAFACGWMLIAFVPVSNLIPLHNVFAERYLYLSAVGFCVAVATQIARLRRRTPRSLLLAALCATYSALTLGQIRAMKDNHTLWTRTLAYEPKSARAWVWTGLELKRAGLRNEARQHFQRAIQIKPRETSAIVNLAILSAEDGDLAAAESLLRAALEREPDKTEIWWNLAVCLNALGRVEEAKAATRRALQCNPYFEPALRAVHEMYRADAVNSQPFQSLEK